MSTDALRACRSCAEPKGLDEFYFSRTRNVYETKCKPCYRAQATRYRLANPAKVAKAKRQSTLRKSEHYRAKQRAWADANRDRLRKHFAKHRYGLSPEQYDALDFTACAICRCALSFGKGRQTTPCIDHCHTTGKVRGVLCFGCNVALGNAKDDPAVLRAMAEYLELPR